MSTQHQFWFFCAVAVIAATLDVARRRIPNWVTVPIAVTGLIAQAASGGGRGAASGTLAALVVTAVLLFAWSKRLVGGGDAKLAGAAAAWLGLGSVPEYLLLAILLGGLLAIGCYVLSSREAREAMWANSYHLHAPALPAAARAPGRTLLVPYGVAFVGAALVILGQRVGGAP